MCASGGHLQKHLLLMLHNRHDGDKVGAGSGMVCFSMGPICSVDAAVSPGPQECVASQSNLAQLCSVSKKSCI